MSLTEALRGARIELGRCPSLLSRAQYVSRTAKLVVQELAGLPQLAPFAVRSTLLHRRLQRGWSGVRLQPDVSYGGQERNLMDIYQPCNAAHEAANGAGAPTVLFVHGGVWSSGERWHSTQLANALAQQGFMVCVMSYSLYPEARVDTMVRSLLLIKEVSGAITWLMDNAKLYGGDSSRVSLFGHSAGAHLALMALLHRSRAASHQSKDARMPQTAVLAAGVHDVQWHYEYEAARGVHLLSTMERCMGGWHRCRARSPSVLVQSALARAQSDSVSALGMSTSSTHRKSTKQQAARSNEPPASEHGTNKATALQPPAGVSLAPAAQPVPDAAGAGVDSRRAMQAMPDVKLLDPPERVNMTACFKLAGQLVAHRLAGMQPAQASTDDTSRQYFADRCHFDTQAEDAAERFAASLTVADLKRLPPLALATGTADLTVPWYESAEMARVLQDAGVQAQLLMYNSVAHTDWVTDWPGRHRSGQRTFHEDLHTLLTGA